MNQNFIDDYYRYTGKKWSFWRGIKYLISDHSLCYLYLFRKMQLLDGSKGRIMIRLLVNHMRRKYGLEIPYRVVVSGGFYIGHAFNITINPNTVIGRNINIHKGVTIGRENRGKRKGTPIIGDFVWIGVNATIVGNIKIGSNVLIAPNSFVNFDVPDNSLVIGNPARIISKEDVTNGYINNAVF